MAAYKPIIGTTFWRYISKAVLVYVVRILLSNAVSHQISAICALEPSESYRL